MMKERIYKWLNNNQGVKKWMHSIMVDPIRTRPRLWLRVLMIFYTKRGRGSIIYSNVRKDIVPFNIFSLGKKSVVESFSVINNMVGDVNIGDSTRIGIGNTIIGPVTIGDNVMLAQNVVISGIDHIYQNVEDPISAQDVASAMVLISNDSWIGANSVITKGVKIGKHSIVAAGSVVKRDVDDFTIVAGNPAKPVKRYDTLKSIWEKV